MKLTTINEVEVSSARVKILIDPDTQKTTMTLEYTCPKCAGHGCNRHSSNNTECSGGTVIRKLDPANLNKVFEPGQLMKITAAVHNLFLEITND